MAWLYFVSTFQIKSNHLFQATWPIERQNTETHS